MGSPQIRCRTSKTILLLLLAFLWPGDVLPSGEGTGLMIAGEESLVRGDLTEAARLFEEALPYDFRNPRLLSGLGRTYFHLNRFDEAQERLREALLNDPEQEWVRCWSTCYLGKVHAAKIEYSTAMEYFRLATDLPETPNCIREAHEHLAYLRLIDFSRKEFTETRTLPCCTLHYRKDVATGQVIGSLAREVAGYHEKILRLLGFESGSAPIHIYLYPSRWKYDLWEAKEILARRIPEEIHIYFDGQEEMGPLEHEMVHAMTTALNEKGPLSPFFMEGLAEYVVGNPLGIPLHKWVKGFLSTGRFISLSLLADGRSFRQVNPIVSYTEAGSFVQFLIKQYGLDLVLRSIAQNGAWEAVFNKNVRELEQDWLRDIALLELSEEEMGLLKYRVWLGHFFTNQRLHKKRLPWIGITFSLSGEDVIVDRIAAFSPGEKAGLRSGDRIEKIDDIPITRKSCWRLTSTVQQKEVGDEVTLLIDREGERKTVTVRLEREREHEQEEGKGK